MLELRNVAVATLRDPGEVILEGVNWTVLAGEFWAVGGLLRSGKSDLLALAVGINRPARGVHRVFGEELEPGFEHEQMPLRLRLGLVFDGGQLLHHLTLAENVSLPLRYHPQKEGPDWEARSRALLEFTGLAQWADRFPAQVTRNWQQRIGLARALALSPEVLLLDSPLTGLDPRDAGWWTDTLSALSAGHPILAGRPLTLVVTSDNLRPWVGRASHFAVLQNRRFHALGTRAELERHPEALVRDVLPSVGAGI